MPNRSGRITLDWGTIFSIDIEESRKSLCDYALCEYALCDYVIAETSTLHFF